MLAASTQVMVHNSGITNLACQKPKDLGYAAELWSLEALANHIRKTTPFSSLSKIVKSTVHSILKENELQPHKLTYYLEKRDPEFEKKMYEVLMVYKEVNLIAEGKPSSSIVTVSVDEKPGVQAIQNTADHSPVCSPMYCLFFRTVSIGSISKLFFLA